MSEASPHVRPVAVDTRAHGAGPTGRYGLGLTAMVLGVLAVLLCWTVIGGVLLGVLAVVLGLLGRRRALRGEADDGAMAVAGIITGVVGVALPVLLLVPAVSLRSSSSGSSGELEVGPIMPAPSTGSSPR